MCAHNKNCGFMPNYKPCYVGSKEKATFKKKTHYVKSVQIRSFFGPYFPAFELNTDRYEVSLRIQSKCETMRTRQSSVFGQISHNDSDSDLFTFL